jgi:hypothetical protein
MKYALQTGSRVVIYIPTVIKIGLAIQELMGWIGGYTDSMVTA